MSKVLEIKNVKDFNTDHIFACGQCFRWEKQNDNSFAGVAFGKAVNISYDANTETLRILNSTQKDYDDIWEDYLDLKRDYGEIKKEFSGRDKILKEAIDYGQGIRILKQDKWETLISFIISQNNHIPRIKKCIETLCENFGQEIAGADGKKYFTFPSYSVLAELEEEDLAVCKLGYRSKYIIETSRAVNADGGKKLQETEVNDVNFAYEYLTSLCGVGPKVANCIMLFSMAKWEAFPVDVWVRRVMHHLYGIDEKDMAGMAEYARQNFAPWAGLAQQYLFYYIQSKGIKLK